MGVCPAYGACHAVGQSAFVFLIWRTSMTSSYLGTEGFIEHYSKCTLSICICFYGLAR